MNIIFSRSPNFKVSKKFRNIKFLIIHYTGMKNFQSAVDKLKDPNSEVSCHYVISRSGRVLELVKPRFIAWHAGVSAWRGIKNINKNSVGIELENKGHDFVYQKFSKVQIKNLIVLLKKLKKKFKIKNINIIGHSDVAPSRKKDPGEKFPWKILSLQDVGIFNNLEEKILKYYRRKKIIGNASNKEIINLAKKIGYTFKNISNKNFFYFTKAFQRRFRQNLISGYFDQECYLILRNLVKLHS